MNDVLFIIPLGILIETHLYYGQDRDLPTRARILYQSIVSKRRGARSTKVVKFDRNQKV